MTRSKNLTNNAHNLQLSKIDPAIKSYYYASWASVDRRGAKGRKQRRKCAPLFSHNFYTLPKTAEMHFLISLALKEPTPMAVSHGSQSFMLTVALHDLCTS